MGPQGLPEEDGRLFAVSAREQAETAEQALNKRNKSSHTGSISV
jgi:hypothetical protein